MAKARLTLDPIADARRRSIMVEEERRALFRAVRGCDRLDGKLIVVEIGVKRAGTSRLLLAELANMGRPADLIGVDIAGAAKSWWARRMPKRFGLVNARFIREKGYKAAEGFNDVALLFVDGCHCFDCVHAEISAWRLRVRVGGYMVFHDTRPSRQAKAGKKAAPHDESIGYGVRAAIASFTDGRFGLVEDVEARSGLQVYCRVE